MGALLQDLYEVMALKARLDCGKGDEADRRDPRLAGRVAHSTDTQSREALRLARRAQPGWARVSLERRLDFAGAFHRALRASAEEFVDVLVAEGHQAQVARWELASLLSITHPDSLAFAHQTLEWTGEVAGRQVRLVRKPESRMVSLV
ncbi:aldehyde dehydrogenase family protein [Streptomyces sp. NPDC050355]|uniref:aldehyde dehydrogenase family protein n=1 Tax=Streptomyces sp. NPDC050355 TaxID=3365609 RepID=UPI00378C7EF2